MSRWRSLGVRLHEVRDSRCLLWFTRWGGSTTEEWRIHAQEDLLTGGNCLWENDHTLVTSPAGQSWCRVELAGGLFGHDTKPFLA